MTVLSLAFGLGLFLLYDWWTAPRRTDRIASPRSVARARRWLADAGVPDIAPAQLAGGCALSALGGATLAALLFDSASVALVTALAGAAAPIAYLRGRARRRRAALRRCWPDAIELLAGTVRAGDTLPAALAVVAEQGPNSLRPAFRALVADHRVSGDLPGALERLGVLLGDPISDRVVVTRTVASRVGGRELGRVLRTLAAFLREDQAVRQEIEARQSWTVVAARVAAGAPWLVLLLVASRPQGRHAYDSVAGLVLLGAGALATIVGYRMMLAIGRLPDEPRLLEPAR
jgi:tight adherence protein B